MTDRTDAAAETAAAQDTRVAAPADIAAAPDIGRVSGVLSAREAATALGVSERTVRRAIHRSELVTTKHAGSFQITPAAIDDYRRRETGQRTLWHAAIPGSAAAASDFVSGQAAAADTGQGSGDAVGVLRELLAEEGRKSDSLLEASLIWQTRALQLEQRLKELEAGPIAQDAGDVDQDVPQERDPATLRGDVALRASSTVYGAYYGCSGVTEPSLTEELIAATMARADRRVCTGQDRWYAFPDPLHDARDTCTPKGRCKVG